MALPKRRISSTRSRTKSSSSYVLKAKVYSVCPNCGEPKHSHRVCMKCGFYKGQQVINIKEK